jgi:hypothetical protein
MPTLYDNQNNIRFVLTKNKDDEGYDLYNPADKTTIQLHVNTYMTSECQLILDGQSEPDHHHRLMINDNTGLSKSSRNRGIKHYVSYSTKTTKNSIVMELFHNNEMLWSFETIFASKKKSKSFLGFLGPK